MNPSATSAGVRQSDRSHHGLRRLAATALLTAVSFAGAVNTARFTVTDSGTPIPQGSTGTQTITVTNVGPDAGTNVVTTYTPPTTPGLTVNSVMASPGGACTPGGGVYTCPSVSSVVLNGKITLTVNMTVAGTVPVGTSAGSTVKVNSAEFNPGSGTGESLFNIWGARGVSGAAGDAYWYGFDGNYDNTGIKTETGSVDPGTGSKIVDEWPVAQAYPPGKYSEKADKANDNSDNASYAPYGTTTAAPAAPKDSTIETTPPTVYLGEGTDSRNNRRVWEVRTGIYLANDGPLFVCVPQPDDAMYVAVDGQVVAYANTYKGGVVNSSGGTFARGYHEVVYRIVNRNNQRTSFEHGPGGFGLLGMGTTAATTVEQTTPATACNSANYNAFTRVAPSSDVTIGSPMADLAVTKTNGVNVNSVKSGAATTYTIRVTNNGPSTVTGATLTDTPGAGLNLTSVVCTATTGNKCTATPTAFSVTLPTLAKGEFYEVKVTGTVTATGGSVTNRAEVKVPTGVTDPDQGSTPTNNVATDTDNVLLVRATLNKTVTNERTEKTGTSADGLPGDTLEYCIAFKNEGNVALPNFTLTDSVPGNTTGQKDAYGSGQGVKVTRGTAASYQAFANPVAVNLGTLGTGESGRMCFKAKIN